MPRQAPSLNLCPPLPTLASGELQAVTEAYLRTIGEYAECAGLVREHVQWHTREGLREKNQAIDK